MPETMRVLAHHAPSGPFTEVELPVPTPGHHDLVAETRAVAPDGVDLQRAHEQVADGHMVGWPCERMWSSERPIPCTGEPVVDVAAVRLRRREGGVGARRRP